MRTPVATRRRTALRANQRHIDGVVDSRREEVEEAMIFAFIVYIVAAFGIAYVFGFALITKRAREIMFSFAPTRWLVLLIECPACFGFWIGILAVMLDVVPFTLLDYNGLQWAFFTSGSNLILAKLTKLI
jgi:hypothetical protein